MYIDSNCTGCGLCIDECNFEAISLVGGRAVIDDSLCRCCGICLEICPVGAIKWDNISAPISPEQKNYSRRESLTNTQKPAQNKVLKILNGFDSVFRKDREMESRNGMGRGSGKGFGSGRNSGRRYGKGSGRGRSL